MPSLSSVFTPEETEILITLRELIQEGILNDTQTKHLDKRAMGECQERAAHALEEGPPAITVYDGYETCVTGDWYPGRHLGLFDDPQVVRPPGAGWQIAKAKEGKTLWRRDARFD